MSRGRWYLTYSFVDEMEVGTFRDGVETAKVPLVAVTEDAAVAEGEAKWREIAAAHPKSTPTVVYEKPIGLFPRTPLERRFANLWQRLGASTSAGAVFEDLEARYSEPHRAYHTLDHVAGCLREFSDAKQGGFFVGLFRNVDMDAVELAIWFHDAVYDPRATGELNEERSAELAMGVMGEAGAYTGFSLVVATLVAATSHSSAPLSPGACLLVDIDLAILGTMPERFDEYERQIRREYGWLSDAEFAAGRAKILRSFLARPSIYFTGFFRDWYEKQARRNLERSLARLGT